MKLSPDIISRVTRAATAAVGQVAQRGDNNLSTSAVQDAKPEISTAIEKAVAAENTGDHAIVEVKSAWLSKINITQFVALLAMALSFFGFDLDAKTQAEVLAVIVAVQGVVTWIFRTFFTSTVTASSV